MRNILRLFALALLVTPALQVSGQTPILDEWLLNTTGLTASYWQSDGQPNPSFTYHTTTDSANVLQVCYKDSVAYIRTEGMTTDMGQFTNPGAPSAQEYTFSFPMYPSAATNNVDVPDLFVIAVLVNGIPVFGKGDGSSWDNSSQTSGPMGQGIWNGDAWYGEGMTLDTALAAHPQQQGQYHSHATPFRLYDFPSSGHSPIVGFAFDGYPIYGPYGYDDPNDTNSGIVRMESSYQLRNITVRQTLPDGSSLQPSEYGPDVDTDHPLGEFIEDYEYVSGLGHLDEHNGRFCITPEYPGGTYAYFVAATSNNEATFPYYLGATYYGEVIQENLSPQSTVSVPGGSTCLSTSTDIAEGMEKDMIRVFPTVTASGFTVEWGTQDVQLIRVTDMQGRTVRNIRDPKGSRMEIDAADWISGVYHCSVFTGRGVRSGMIIVQH